MPKVLTYQGHPDGEMIFDFGTKIIHCAATISVLSAQQLFDACLDIEDELISLSDEGIANGEGKTQLGEVSSALTVKLLGWRVRSSKTDGSRFTVNRGNVVVEDVEAQTTSPDIFIDNGEATYVNNLATNSVAGNFTGDLEAILRSLSDTVFIDPVNGQPGTSPGTGLPAQPSNNLADTIEIIAANPIRKLAVLGSLVIDEPLPFITVRSEGGNHTIVLTGTDINASAFSGSIVTGAANGFTTLNFCTVGDITGFLGQMRSCGLLRSIALAPDPIEAPRFVDCFESDPSSAHPTLDLSAGTTTSCSLQRYAGSLTLSGLDNSLKRVEINMIGGQLTLDASCTDGVVLLTGSGAEPINNGSATIIKLGFVTDTSGGITGGTASLGPGALAAISKILAHVSQLASTGGFSAEDKALLQQIAIDAGAIARGDVTINEAENTITLFRPDGTPLTTFRPSDSNGQPTVAGFLQRTRVQETS